VRTHAPHVARMANPKAVIDVASRRVVGWAMTDHLRAEFVTDAVEMASIITGL
jgi:putative transposase